LLLLLEWLIIRVGMTPITKPVSLPPFASWSPPPVGGFTHRARIGGLALGFG